MYHMKISEMLSHRRLPEKLVMLLQNPRVRKVGRMVSSDLKQLQIAVGSSVPFVGALDLATFAKQRHIVANAKCSLADICAAVLQRRMNKSVSERTSAAWEHAHLTPEQLHYAACDAYIPLLLHQQLSKFSIPECLPTELVPSTPVLVYNPENSMIIAIVHLAPDLHCARFDDVAITRRHTLVEITDIFVPAAIVTSHR